MNTRWLTPGALMLLLVQACAPDTPANSTPTAAAVACTSLRSQCLASQQICVLDAQGAHCADCAEGTALSGGGECVAVTGQQVVHEFATFTTGAGEEVLGKCQSWTLHNEEEIWVHAVHMEQDEGSHHSDWTIVDESLFDGPDGVWGCEERGYDFWAGARSGGVLYAQSTQLDKETQSFAEGAAIRVPPHARIIGDVHLFNASEAPITGKLTLRLDTLPASQVTARLRTFHLEYDALTILPRASSRFSSQCAMASDVSTALGVPFNAKLYYLLPHTHALGTRARVSVLGGPLDGQVLMDVPPYDTSKSHGILFDPPVDLAGSQGFSYSCEYANPRDEMVGWGNGSEEMCEIFGFADLDGFFESRVSEGGSDGEADGVNLFSGECVTTVAP